MAASPETNSPITRPEAPPPPAVSTPTASEARATAEHAAEVASGRRFEFGKNWTSFLERLDSNRVARAEQSLRELLDEHLLVGKRFLDVGSGSGLFSLAARRLGATVHSFDLDPRSVACTRELRRRFFFNDERWTIDHASVLDQPYLRGLGPFDVVYAWGVLHHTGAMWRALEHVHRLVAPDGRLVVAIYNDTGSRTARWRWIKRLHAALPAALKTPYVASVAVPLELRSLLRSLVVGRPSDYVDSWTQYRRNRGMDKWSDLVDWVGGYPYETARVDELFQFFTRRGMECVRMRTTSGLGCNEMVFRRRT